MGAPYWDQYARGAITGITRGTGPAHLARATLESIAYLTMDVVEAMVRDSGIRINGLRVDGGASRNNFLMQFQSDVLGIPVIRPADTEATARGAAYLAGLSAGVWSGLDDLKRIPVETDEFTPNMSPEDRQMLYDGWTAAVRRVIGRDHPEMEDK